MKKTKYTYSIKYCILYKTEDGLIKDPMEYGSKIFGEYDTEEQALEDISKKQFFSYNLFIVKKVICDYHF